MPETAMNPMSEFSQPPESGPHERLRNEAPLPTYRPSNRVDAQAHVNIQSAYLTPKPEFRMFGATVVDESYSRPRLPGTGRSRIWRWGLYLLGLAVSGLAGYSLNFSDETPAGAVSAEARLYERALARQGSLSPTAASTGRPLVEASTNVDAGSTEAGPLAVAADMPGRLEAMPGSPLGRELEPSVSIESTGLGMEKSAQADVASPNVEGPRPASIIGLQAQQPRQDPVAAPPTPPTARLAVSSSARNKSAKVKVKSDGQEAPSASRCTEALRAMQLCDARTR